MAASTSGFPVTQGTSFASQFAAVYLNFEAVRSQEREARLAPFLPEGAEPQFGWDGFGHMAAGALQPYGIEVTDGQNAVVTLTYQSGSRRQLLSVPVFYDTDTKKFVVSGRPGILPAPKPRTCLPRAGPTVTRPRSLSFAPPRRLLQGLRGERHRLPAALCRRRGHPGGVRGAFTFVELKDLVVPLPGGATREVTATVVWGVPAGAAPSADPTSDPGDMGEAGAGLPAHCGQAGRQVVRQGHPRRRTVRGVTMIERCRSTVNTPPDR
ncbi:conjugal transfer protein [Streptosporangium lutulentum]